MKLSNESALQVAVKFAVSIESVLGLTPDAFSETLAKAHESALAPVDTVNASGKPVTLECDGRGFARHVKDALIASGVANGSTETDSRRLANKVVTMMTTIYAGSNAMRDEAHKLTDEALDKGLILKGKNKAGAPAFAKPTRAVADELDEIKKLVAIIQAQNESSAQKQIAAAGSIPVEAEKA